jgi:predicted phosphodiesterase
MRVIVLSDVHGNLTALEAVVADIAAQPAVDLVAFAGDACLFGPRPEECAARIRAVADICLVGNTDQWICTPPAVPENAPNRERWQFIHSAAVWTRDQLSASSLDWLGRLPFGHTVSPTAQAEDDLLLVHANPQDTMQVIYPPEETQEARLGKLHQTDEELTQLLAGTVAGALAYGHLHFPNLRTSGRTLLANISSVSLPGDDDARAKYGILEWDGERWQARHVYVPYDVTAEIAALRQTRPPDWANSVATLERLIGISR